MDIIQITDLHISKNQLAKKHDCMPFERLEHILEDIESRYRTVENLAITGDLSDDYTIESYLNIKRLLNKYKFNVSILPGNHDDINMMRKICDEQINLNSIKSSNDHFTIFNFDTHVDNQVGGEIKKEEISSFKSELESYKKQVVVFTHHPLLKMNSDWIDANITENNNLLIQLMLKYSNTLFHIFSGHVHQEFHKKLDNINFYTSPSTCYQFKERSEQFCIDRRLTNGYRAITLHGNSLETRIVRL